MGTAQKDPLTERSGVGSIRRLGDSFEIALQARNLSPRTVDAYLEAVRLFADYLDEAGMPSKADALHREHIEAWLAHELRRVAPASVSIRYRALQQFWKWAQEDGEVVSSPMANLKPPVVPEAPVPVFKDADLAALLKACSGRDFASRRDLAIVRLLLDTGVRRQELTDLRVEDLELRARRATVTGKGRRTRTVAFGHKAAQALDRYLRVRAGHRQATLPWLWLGQSGRLTNNGIAQIVRKRARQAGIDERVNLHRFRHHYAHDRMAEGVEGENLMQLTGWRSRSMLSRYGSSAAASRALEDADRRTAVGDRL